MSNIDLREIPNPAESGHARDRFELFARDFLAASGFRILEEPARGPDGGKDLLVGELVHGVISCSEIRWLVSVKHFAHSGKAVGVNDEPSILERVEQIGADGFLGFYSSTASSALAERLRSLSQRIRTALYGPSKIAEELLANPNFSYVFRQHLPKAFKAQQAMHSSIEFKLFTEAGNSLRKDDVALDLSSMFVSIGDGVLRIEDPELEDIVCACVLANALRKGDFSVLRKVVSLRPLVWCQLSALLARSGLDGEVLDSEIGTATDSFYLRLLIAVAGVARCEQAAESICRRLLVDGRLHHNVVRAMNVPLTPFFDVVREALAVQSPSINPVLTRYIIVAREKGCWAEKRVLEAVLRTMEQGPQNPALHRTANALRASAAR